MKKYGFALLGFLMLSGIDQWTKWIASISLKDRGEISLLGNIFVLQYLENRGAAFGVLQNQRVFLIIITAIILTVLIVIYGKIPSSSRFHILRCMEVLLAAGAMGNLIDRLFRGYVIDFFYFKLIDFPIFNVADCYVVIAAFVCMILIGFYYKEEDWEEYKAE